MASTDDASPSAEAFVGTGEMTLPYIADVGPIDGLVLDPIAQALLFTGAHTPNVFDDTPVTDEQIRALYELIKWAPTSYNQQPLKILLVRDPERRRRLVDCMIDSNQEKTRNAPLSLILAADTEFTEYLGEQFPVVPDIAELFADPVIREESARLNATLQISYLIIGVRALGLDAGPMVGFDQKKLEEIFLPGGRYRALVVMNIGRPGPDAYYPRLPRLEFERVFTVL